MRFDFPLAFLLLLFIPPMLYVFFRRKRNLTGVKFSTTKTVSGIPRSLRQKFLFLPQGIRILGLILLVIALARPQYGREKVKDVSEGIAVFMVVDRSSSMGAEMQLGVRQVERLDAVKQVFSEFVLGDGKDLGGRPNDLIGMISFARYADTVCPLTLSHGALQRFLDSTRLVERRSEDGTAIGDAIALAAARLKTAEENMAGRGGNSAEDYTIKSKIMILLTDGENNAGKRTPVDAARLAAEWGIKIYTIGIGGRENYVTIRTPFGTQKVPVQSDIDERTLKGIAEETDGAYFRAGDVQSLRDIYAEIDRLEKSEIQSIRYKDYQEAFVPFALSAFVMMALGLLLSSTLFRRIP